MKQFAFILSAVMCFGFITINRSLTDAERNFAIQHLSDTKAYLENAINGLSEEQMKFKPSPEKWSINECLEHIAITETVIMTNVTSSFAQPANPEKRSEIKFTDEDIIKRLLDRSAKAKAREILLPKGNYATTKEIVEAFTIERNKAIQLIKTTNDDFRGRVLQHPAFGMIDAYQWILLMSAHVKRHTLQIEEVRSDKNFPNK